MLPKSFLIAGLAIVVLVPGVASAQDDKYSDYTWAKGLYTEFGFDDVAEGIFDEMAKSGRTATEQQQGKLGLAELKQSLARKTDTYADKLALYTESDKLMTGVLRSWPDKESNAYFQALFTQVGLLQELGEAVMEEVRAGRIDGEQATQAREVASNSFAKALTSLEAIRGRMGSPDPEQEREKWRLRNRAWYEQCSVKINEALTYKKNSSKYVIGLEEASLMLEDFILENETDDEEALLGALYGYLLRGKVFEALDDAAEAEASYTGVIDFIRWEGNERLVPVIQALAERAYFQLLAYLVKTESYAKAVTYGNTFFDRWDKRNMVFKTFGRAALVQLAEARLRTGDMNGALQLSSKVVEEAGGDATGRLANRLVAEIIAAATDKKAFSPKIIRSAAKGAYAAGADKIEDAIAYFQILLQVLDKVEDSNEREYYKAEAFYFMGRGLRTLGRNLEAAHAFGKGFDEGGFRVRQDSLSENLARYWRGTLRSLENDTGSAKIKAMLDRAEATIIKRQKEDPSSGVVVSEQDVLYGNARDKAREAKALARTDLARALALYGEASELYSKAGDLDGPKKEQALIRVARTRLDAAEARFKNGQKSEAEPEIGKAVTEFKNFLQFAKNPSNVLSNPVAIAARADAMAIARYSIMKANKLLMPATSAKDAASKQRRKTLIEDSLAFMRGFETEVEGQQPLKMAILYDRLRFHVELGQVDAAKADLAALEAIDRGDSRVGAGAVTIAKSLRVPLEEQWKKHMGKLGPTKPIEFRKALQKSEVQALLPQLRDCYGLYRQWLLSKGGSKKFGDWNFVTSKYYTIGDFKEAVELLNEALSRFGNDSSIKPDDLISMQRRLLFSALELAVNAENDGEDAGAFWAAAGRVADAMMASDNKFAKYASTRRACAVVYGGYLAQVSGRFVYRPALGKFKEAADIWTGLEKALKTKADDSWWEAKFYTLYARYREAREKGQPTSRLVKAINSLEATTGSAFGGQNWRNRFDWLKGQVR